MNFFNVSLLLSRPGFSASSYSSAPKQDFQSDKFDGNGGRFSATDA